MIKETLDVLVIDLTSGILPEPGISVLVWANDPEDEGDTGTREWFKAYLAGTGVFVNAETGAYLVDVTHWRVMPADPVE